MANLTQRFPQGTARHPGHTGRLRSSTDELSSALSSLPPIEGRPFIWHASDASTLTQQMSMRVIVRREAPLEAMIDANNLRPVSFLSQAIQRASAVAQIVVPQLGLGTGFMVADDCLMTNNHVLPSAASARDAYARFNYELGTDGQLSNGDYFRLRPDLFFITNERLDYSIVGVDENPGIRYGSIALTRLPLSLGQGVNIVQHPSGGPKQVALVDNDLVYYDQVFAQYLTDTLPGSSGSPVFDDNWQLIALHNSGGWLPEPGTQSTHFRNQGILISAILDDLTAKGLATGR